LPEKQVYAEKCRFMPETVLNRMVIYTKDVMNITGRKERAARVLLLQIKKKYRKKKGELISVEEFCLYTGLCEDKVMAYLV
jgi:hypothetical protein